METGSSPRSGPAEVYLETFLVEWKQVREVVPPEVEETLKPS